MPGSRRAFSFWGATRQAHPPDCSLSLLFANKAKLCFAQQSEASPCERGRGGRATRAALANLDAVPFAPFDTIHRRGSGGCPCRPLRNSTARSGCSSTSIRRRTFSRPMQVTVPPCECLDRHRRCHRRSSSGQRRAACQGMGTGTSGRIAGQLGSGAPAGSLAKIAGLDDD